VSTPRLTVWLAFVAMAADIGLARLGYGLVLPAARAELGGAYSVYGAIGTWHLAGYLAGSLATPFIVRRTGTRTAFAFAHVAVALTLLAQAAATDALWLGIVRTVMGIATGVAIVTAVGAALESVPASRRSLTSSVIWSGVAVALIASAPVGQWALHGVGRWRVASAIMALPALAVAIGALWQRFPTAVAPATAAATGGAPLRAVLEPHKFAFLFLAYIGFGFAYLVYATFVMSRFLAQSGGGGTATLLWAAYGLTAGIGALAIVRVMNSRLHGFALVVSLGVAVVGALVSVLPGAQAAVLGALCIGLGLAATPAVASAYARERVDAAAAPRAIAMVTAAAGVGQIIGPFVGGIVADLAGLAAIPLLVAAVYAAAMVFAFIDQRASA
jgi:predicted MFS family arabinose efflux permease